MSEYIKVRKDNYEKLIELFTEYVQSYYDSEKDLAVSTSSRFTEVLAALETEMDDVIEDVKELTGYDIEIDRGAL